MNKKQKLLSTLMIMGLAIMFGCSAIQDVITPTFISEDAAAWADVPAKLIMPYTTLLDAKRIKAAIFFKRRIEGAWHESMIDLSIFAGEEIKTVVFSPNGPVGLLMPTIIGAGLGGLFIKRPKDKQRIEELEKANGGKK